MAEARLRNRKPILLESPDTINSLENTTIKLLIDAPSGMRYIALSNLLASFAYCAIGAAP